ncbi:MAG TPA: hypothetical protein VLJ88_13850 [Propionibacteriaceae bacterium]|nr:hypothetical protein [Propionibacteriaceae bacterium]
MTAGKFETREELVKYMTAHGAHKPECPLPTGRPEVHNPPGSPDWSECTCT